MRIEETDRDAHFKYLTIEKSNQVILFADTFLKNCNNSFKGKTAPVLNEECDGIIITDYNGNKFIIFIELKSKFEKGVDKGPKQLLASCFKALTLFNCIDGFSFNDYNLCAVLALQKPSTESLNKVRQKEEIKEDLTGLDQLKKKAIEKEIIESEISMEEYLFNTLPIKPTYCSDLPLVIYTIEPDKDSGAINLDTILSKVYHK
ncbi:MAG: hypothetical protein IJ785_00020 [Bacteroidales bacterium]|nr:hypothetical protein [Bacteroidales bacterium]